MRREASKVFFPWERKRGFAGALGRTRLGIVALVVVAVLLVVLVRLREERAAAVRATRATLTGASRAVSAYRAEHRGQCPHELADLVAGGYARDVPVDAWGHPLRLTCPGGRDPAGFDLSSDGPDGLPGGLDRVE